MKKGKSKAKLFILAGVTIGGQRKFLGIYFGNSESSSFGVKYMIYKTRTRRYIYSMY
jgi:transposase-like protein